MSEVNWGLIDDLDRRFNSLIGIATEERLQQLYDNFHLISIVLDGRLEEYMQEFVPVQPPVGAGPADLAGAQERLRQYNLPQFPLETVRSIVEAAGLFFPEECGEEFVREKADTARRVRMKLLRFDRRMSLHAIERILRAKELTPASLAQLATFAMIFPQDLPKSRLVATGSLVVDGPEEDSDITLAAVDRSAGDECCQGLIHRVSIPGFSVAFLEPGEVVLAARYPRERKCEQRDVKVSVQETKESVR